MNSRYSRQIKVPILKHNKHHLDDDLFQAVNRSQEVLFSANTIFPLTLFPDTITVDREKLTITHRRFFGAAESMSIRIEDILNVTADVGPFWGSLKISTRFFDPHRPYVVRNFWRSDVIRLKRIIQGYIIAKQENIDCSTYQSRDLAFMLHELGHGGLNQEI